MMMLRKRHASSWLGIPLADLGGTRLSILQDPATERFVYRGLNSITKEVEG